MKSKRRKSGMNNTKEEWWKWRNEKYTKEEVKSTWKDMKSTQRKSNMKSTQRKSHEKYTKEEWYEKYTKEEWHEK